MHYLSGFISEITLKERADVSIFLLFPKKYVKKLNANFFNEIFLKINASRDYSEEYMGAGNIFGEYIPFCVPLYGSYCKDNGITLKETNESNKLNKLFKGRLTNYFKNIELNKNKIKDENEEINEDNIFNYLKVGLEHQKFIDNISCNILEMERETYEDLFQNGIDSIFNDKILTLSQEWINGKNNYFKIKESDLKKMRECFLESFIILSIVSDFLNKTNKIFKPCDYGSQNLNKEYALLLNNERKNLLK